MFQLLSKFMKLDEEKETKPEKEAKPTYAEVMHYDGLDGNRFQKPGDCSSGSDHYCSGRGEG